MARKKTEEIYSHEKEIEYFYSPESKSFTTAIIKKELDISVSLIEKMFREGGEGKKVLDIGCSGGRYAFNLAKKGFDVVGIDIVKNAVDFANAKKKELGLSNVKFEVGEIAQLKFKENVFDIIICIEVLHHLSNEELAAGLKEMNRVLKPGGVVIIDLKNKLNPIINLAYKRLMKKKFEGTGHLMLTRAPKDYEGKIKSAGFKILSKKAVFSPITAIAPVIIYLARKE